MAEKDFVRVESAGYRPDGGAYGNVLKSITEDGVCPFCPDHLAKYHEKPILRESDAWVLTENMYPYKGSSAHLLAIHRAHIEHMAQLTPEAWGELRELTIAELSLRGIAGATFMMRFGDTRYNGASVNHLHAQVVAGSGDSDADAIVTRVG